MASAVVQRDLDEICSRDLPWSQLYGSTILVTGAAGMIPSYTVMSLLALNDKRDAGITVYGLVRSKQRAMSRLADVVDRADFELIEQDVAEPIALSGRLDLVIHGASPARPREHAANPVATIRSNVQGTFALLDLCVASKCGKFALMSSAEVYGRQPPNIKLISEGDYGGIDILNTRACYSEGKRAAETIAASYAAQFGIATTIARFGHIYGPGMPLDDGRVQADFAADVIAGRDIVLNSDGSATRTYTYVADAVAGMYYALLLGNDLAYNVADRGGLVSIRRLAETFAQSRPEKKLQTRVRPSSDKRAYNSIPGQGLDSERIQDLGWSPEVGLVEGVNRTLAWHEEAAGPRRLH